MLQREILYQQALLTFEQLTSAYEEQARYEQVASYAAKLLALDPYREPSHRRVMSLLTLRGLPDQALIQFATCRQLMMEEFGVEPAAETGRWPSRFGVANFNETRREGDMERGRGVSGSFSLSPCLPLPLSARLA